MIYNLTYRPRFLSPSEAPAAELTAAGFTLKWVAPTGMSEDDIVDDFERQFFGTSVVSLEPTEVAA
jgi:hypothetical protein